MTAARQVARDRNRDETLDLATDVLVMGGEPSAGWAALDAAAASARINSTRVRTGRCVMALASITRDTGDFGEALRHAREFVALDLRTRDYARWFLISKSACPLAGTRIAAPVDELNCVREVRNWHSRGLQSRRQRVCLLGQC